MSNIEKLSETITFGKHKGKTFEFIFENHFNYLEWLNNNKIIIFNDDIKRKISNKSIEIHNYKQSVNSNKYVGVNDDFSEPFAEDMYFGVPNHF